MDLTGKPVAPSSTGNNYIIMTAIESWPCPSKAIVPNPFLPHTNVHMPASALQDSTPSFNTWTTKHPAPSKASSQQMMWTSSWSHQTYTAAMLPNTLSTHSRTNLLLGYAALTKTSQFTYGIGTSHRLKPLARLTIKPITVCLASTNAHLILIVPPLHHLAHASLSTRISVSTAVGYHMALLDGIWA